MTQMESYRQRFSVGVSQICHQPSLGDPEWEEGQAPHAIGRVQFGRILIANSDREATALIDAAFDATWRAVGEQG